MDLHVVVSGKARVRAATPSFAMRCDVVVVGLGTAGAAAFAASVAEGLRTFGVEKCAGMGGQGTIGCICFGGGLLSRLRQYEEAARKGTVAYESVVVGVWREGTRLAGVRYLRNGVLADVAAKVVIDASGNAMVARLCGLPVRQGRSFDGVMAPCSRGETWLDPSGRIHPTYRNYPDGLAGSAAAYSATVTKLDSARHENWKVQSRRERMLRASALVNAREESRVVTEEILTLADALRERVFPDPVFYAWEPEDLPVFFGDHVFESEEIQNWKVLCGLPMFGYPSTLTYGTLVAKGVDNLLTPSKHFGVAHDLGGGLRMQGEMRKTGIVAACAAAIMARRGCAARDVPYGELKPMLERAGTLEPARKNRVNACSGHQFDPYSNEQTAAALRQDITRTHEWWQGAVGRATNSPAEQAAYALWTCWKCRLSGQPAAQRRLADVLAGGLEENPRFAGNFAVALGLLEDRRCLPVLRELVARPGGPKDPVVPRAYPNRIKALLLLGRFTDVASVPALVAIVEDGAQAFTRDLASAQAFAGPMMCRFQALATALCALRGILHAHPDATAQRRVEAAQDRLPPMPAGDGVDLRERLQAIRVGTGGDVRTGNFQLADVFN
ncbi:MAG: FAD-dependent oxidoreductase [Kiritimatiellia bacterium]